MPSPGLTPSAAFIRRAGPPGGSWLRSQGCQRGLLVLFTWLLTLQWAPRASLGAAAGQSCRPLPAYPPRSQSMCGCRELDAAWWEENWQSPRNRQASIFTNNVCHQHSPKIHTVIKSIWGSFIYSSIYSFTHLTNTFPVPTL